MNKIKPIILVLVSLATLPLSQTAFACDIPEKTITEFIQRDLRGERLSHEVSKEIDKLQTDNQFEPAWDASVVVTDYKIEPIKIDGDIALASVLFNNSWTTSGKFDEGNVIEAHVEIHLKKIHGCWKISPPFTMPRIYPEALLKHFQELIKEDKRTHVEKRILLEHEKQLNALRAYVDYVKRKNQAK
jgi:hypothetical protein